jgi:hypothetical protein
LEKQ